MRGPLQRLKAFPWITLCQNALLTVVLAVILDILLLVALFGLWRVFPSSGRFFMANGWVLPVLPFLAAAGVGALAVVLMERVFSGTRLDTGTLWALVGCLAGVLFLKSQLPLPELLVGFSYAQFVGLTVGLFSQGRRYWR